MDLFEIDDICNEDECPSGDDDDMERLTVVNPPSLLGDDDIDREVADVVEEEKTVNPFFLEATGGGPSSTPTLPDEEGISAFSMGNCSGMVPEGGGGGFL